MAIRTSAVAMLTVGWVHAAPLGMTEANVLPTCATVVAPGSASCYLDSDCAQTFGGKGGRCQFAKKVLGSKAGCCEPLPAPLPTCATVVAPGSASCYLDSDCAQAFDGKGGRCQFAKKVLDYKAGCCEPLPALARPAPLLEPKLVCRPYSQCGGQNFDVCSGCPDGQTCNLIQGTSGTKLCQPDNRVATCGQLIPGSASCRLNQDCPPCPVGEPICQFNLRPADQVDAGCCVCPIFD